MINTSIIQIPKNWNLLFWCPDSLLKILWSPPCCPANFHSFFWHSLRLLQPLLFILKREHPLFLSPISVLYQDFSPFPSLYSHRGFILLHCKSTVCRHLYHLCKHRLFYEVFCLEPPNSCNKYLIWILIQRRKIKSLDKRFTQFSEGLFPVVKHRQGLQPRLSWLMLPSSVPWRN